MDDRTLTALRQSIEKWERNAVAETPEDFTTSASDCALCDLFRLGCDGCPVMDATGEEYCKGSPYNDVTDALEKWDTDESNAALRDAAQAAARAEVEFLRSLLPEEEITP